MPGTQQPYSEKEGTDLQCQNPECTETWHQRPQCFFVSCCLYTHQCFTFCIKLL